MDDGSGSPEARGLASLQVADFDLPRHLIWLLHLSETLLSRLNKGILLPAAVCVLHVPFPSTPARKSSQRGYQLLPLASGCCVMPLV